MHSSFIQSNLKNKQSKSEQISVRQEVSGGDCISCKSEQLALQISVVFEEEKTSDNKDVTISKNEVVEVCQLDVSRELHNCCICLESTEEDMISLESCCHFAHIDCLKNQISAGSSAKRISFAYLSCGECRAPLAHSLLAAELEPHCKLKHDVEQISVAKCLEDDVIDGLSDLIKADERAAKELCLNKVSCFFCNACKAPFCAGLLNCADDEELDVSTLYCSSCAFDSQKQTQKQHAEDWRGKCEKHGYKYAMYKCDSCCSLATFDCRSNHYCDRCHNAAHSKKDYPCPGRDLCPLGIDHPPNEAAVHGQVVPGFIIGCFKCFTSFEGDVELGNEDHWKDRF